MSPEDHPGPADMKSDQSADPFGGGPQCTPNISVAERRKRLYSGLLMFAVGIVVLGVLVATDVSRWWRLPLFVLFVGAAFGFFQWRDKT